METKGRDRYIEFIVHIADCVSASKFQHCIIIDQLIHYSISLMYSKKTFPEYIFRPLMPMIFL